MGTASAWTAERRARQAAAIREWRPWEHSTGPKSGEGKAKVAQNRHRAEFRRHERELRKQLRLRVAIFRLLVERDGINPYNPEKTSFPGWRRNRDKAKDDELLAQLLLELGPSSLASLQISLY